MRRRQQRGSRTRQTHQEGKQNGGRLVMEDVVECRPLSVKIRRRKMLTNLPPGAANDVSPSLSRLVQSEEKSQPRALFKQ